jgi:hypothetical protein
MAFRVFCGILALSLGRFALAYNSPPTGAITIGSGGTYATISAALQDTSSSVYFVYAGTYAEQVYITRANVKIYGQTKYSHTYTGNRTCLPAGIEFALTKSHHDRGHHYTHRELNDGGRGRPEWNRARARHKRSALQSQHRKPVRERAGAFVRQDSCLNPSRSVSPTRISI